MPKKIGFLLAHGSWHGAWCWGLVQPYLIKAGYVVHAIDFLGHGLQHAISLQSYQYNIIDRKKFTSEPSPFANIKANDFAQNIIDGATILRDSGVDQIITVGHSMGGALMTFAAAKIPELFNKLIYIAAILPVGNKPVQYYLSMDAQRQKAKLSKLLLADPNIVGALRIDPRHHDKNYLSRLKDALAHDVNDTILTRVNRFLTTDAPVSIYQETLDFNHHFANIKKYYIRCTEDFTVVPEIGQAIVDDMNSIWKNHPTELYDISSSHEVIFAKPKELSDLLIKIALQ